MRQQLTAAVSVAEWLNLAAMFCTHNEQLANETYNIRGHKNIVIRY